MANQIHISKLNPVSFREIAPPTSARYLTKHYEDYRYADTLKEWEEKPHYCQKFQNSDNANFQFISNFSSIQLDVIDSDNRNYATMLATQLIQDKYNPGWWAFEAQINWAGYSEGVYFITLTLGGVLRMISEPIFIRTIHENTIIFGYRNNRFHEGVIFETNILFQFRVEGSIGRLLPGTSEQYYIDQQYSTTLLRSKPYNNFRLEIGGVTGIPDWVIDKLNFIWSCNDVSIDGISYSKVSDAKFTFNEEELYPLRGIEMEITPGINRGSKVIGVDIDPTKKLVVSYNIDSLVFGGMGPGNTVVITNFE